MKKRAKLAHRARQRIFNALAVPYVTAESSAPNDQSIPAAQRCNCQFNVDSGTILSEADRFELSN